MDYIVIDTDKTTNHCVYARFDSDGTYGDEELAKEITRVNPLISMSAAKSFIAALPEAVENILLKGRRCQIKDFVTFLS